MQSRDNGCLEYSRQKVVGEPDEGKPHVRFDVAGDENQDMVIALRHSRKKWRETSCHHLNPRRHPLTLPADVWESARFRSIFLASGFFYISNIVHARPHAANANRW